MSIPFVRQYPNRRVLSEFNGLTVIVENIAKEFIAKGGIYLTEIMPDGRVRVAAIIQDDDGKQKDVIETFCVNGPELLPSITRLVVASIKHVKGRKASQETMN